ncbi:uncharacterized protein NP_2212A [Natronomonas pharaonis DSM 2160]|uniref:Uncharacterized protein n=1 Tax=Natronomonas pharaonis (strain ATCC 35678 / DSM 2160 / CIP 103997 / JCM 8858 / NBRC 14720 / NCIMB 2260 / Gabara) TaxID=348780 RepID=A0A1U7EVW0_NATPD|nr:hypothetical protein [Natronomonas pharaonis]CAI49197.1 uncharacterized protein NP_2212A [Natronomonas pharaonis DSM 2160]
MNEGIPEQLIRRLSDASRLVPLALLAVVAAVIYVWRPLFHGLIYRVAYSPSLLILVGTTVVAGIALVFWPRMGEDPLESAVTKWSILGTIVVAALVLSVAYSIPAGMAEERSLAQDATADAEAVTDFPTVNEENPRIVPEAVANVQTKGSVSYRQHELGASDIARTEDGRLAWSYPIQPGPFQVRLSGHQRGVLLSDMTAMEDREMQAFDEHEFARGQAMLFHRSADWGLKKSDYWAQYRDDPVEFVHDGEAYMAFPKTGHEWRLTPVPHTVPVWEGVALVHQDGTIEHFDADEAADSEVLDGQRLYPIYNAQREAESLRFRNGIVNQLPIVGTFEGVIEPAGLPSGAGNEQPFTIDLEGEEMAYVMAMEPYGQDTRGLDEVWFFNAETGETVYYETGGDTLLGPERATDIVRAEDTRTDWDTAGSDGEFRAVEPVPVVVDEELWWHSKVVPTDNSDVTRNVFVSAHSGAAVELHDTEAVIDFIEGEDVEDIDEAEEVGEVGTEPADEEEDIAYYVVITDEAGEEVDRIPVAAGEEVTIVDDTDDEATAGD